MDKDSEADKVQATGCCATDMGLVYDTRLNGLVKLLSSCNELEVAASVFSKKLLYTQLAQRDYQTLGKAHRQHPGALGPSQHPVAQQCGQRACLQDCT